MSPACATMREALPWFVGGELEPARAAAVREHLVECLACRTEAAAWRQSRARLQRAASAAVPGVDDGFFQAMHSAIVAEVAAGDRAPAAPPRQLHWWMVLAAVLLLGLGFFAGRGRSPATVFERAPLATPAAFDTPLVVPWAGERVPLQWLGDERRLSDGAAATDQVESGQGAGMMGRTTLRTLAEDRMILPRR